MVLWSMANLCGESVLSEQSLPRTPSWLNKLSINPVILSKTLGACPPRRLVGSPRLNLRNQRNLCPIVLCAFTPKFLCLNPSNPRLNIFVLIRVNSRLLLNLFMSFFAQKQSNLCTFCPILFIFYLFSSIFDLLIFYL